MAQAQAGGQDRELEWIIALAGIVIVLFIIGYFFGDYMVYGLLKTAQAKLWLVGWVYPPYGEYADKIGRSYAVRLWLTCSSPGMPSAVSRLSASHSLSYWS